MKEVKTLKEIKEDLIQFANTRPPNSYRDGYIDGVKIVFEKVNSVSKFYQRYKGQPFAFHSEEYKGIIGNESLHEFLRKFQVTFGKTEVFDNWLYTYCFGDVGDS